LIFDLSMQNFCALFFYEILAWKHSQEGIVIGLKFFVSRDSRRVFQNWPRCI